MPDLTSEFADDDRPLEEVAETYPSISGLPLRLSLTPRAIREHFEDISRVQRLGERTLVLVGEHVLTSDDFYRAFHAALRAAFEEVCGFDPDDELEDDEDAPPTAADAAT